MSLWQDSWKLQWKRIPSPFQYLFRIQYYPKQNRPSWTLTGRSCGNCQVVWLVRRFLQHAGTQTLGNLQVAGIRKKMAQNLTGQLRILSDLLSAILRLQTKWRDWECLTPPGSFLCSTLVIKISQDFLWFLHHLNRRMERIEVEYYFKNRNAACASPKSRSIPPRSRNSFCQCLCTAPPNREGASLDVGRWTFNKKDIDMSRLAWCKKIPNSKNLRHRVINAPSTRFNAKSIVKNPG